MVFCQYGRELLCDSKTGESDSKIMRSILYELLTGEFFREDQTHATAVTNATEDELDLLDMVSMSANALTVQVTSAKWAYIAANQDAQIL